MPSEIQHFQTYPIPQTKPYAFQPFPQWVTPPDGKAARIVKDAAEYEVVTGKPWEGAGGEPVAPTTQPPEPNVFKPEPVSINARPSEKEQLVQYAVGAGIPIDRRWGIEKIKKAIEAHKVP